MAPVIRVQHGPAGMVDILLSIVIRFRGLIRVTLIRASLPKIAGTRRIARIKAGPGREILGPFLFADIKTTSGVIVMSKQRRYQADASGPDYPPLGAVVAKWRWRAREGLRSLTREERQAYGEAVERAILALQRAEANHGSPPINPRVNCASGTAHTTGEAIHQAIREQQARALAAYPSYVRRNRSPHIWQQMYEAAMADRKAAMVVKEAA